MFGCKVNLMTMEVQLWTTAWPGFLSICKAYCDNNETSKPFMLMLYMLLLSWTTRSRDLSWEISLEVFGRGSGSNKVAWNFISPCLGFSVLNSYNLRALQDKENPHPAVTLVAVVGSNPWHSWDSEAVKLDSSDESKGGQKTPPGLDWGHPIYLVHPDDPDEGSWFI